MLQEEIIGALQAGLQRGESFGEAIQTLINAGYLKEEVEEAAHFLQRQKELQQKPVQTKPAIQKTIKKGFFKQKISKYGEEPKPKKQKQILTMFL